MPLEQKMNSFWCVVWMFKTRIGITIIKGQQQHHNCGGDQDITITYICSLGEIIT